MGYPQFKTVVLTSMFISVLFLTGCGKQEETKAITDDTTTPTVEQTVQPTSDTDDNAADSTPTTTPGATTTPSNTETIAGKSYTSAFQTYKTPAGNEEVKVTAIIDAQGIVKKIALAYVTNAPKSKVFQDMFSQGIEEQVIGKSIKDIHVGDVNGSSLTAEGFNKAIDQIETTYYANAK